MNIETPAILNKNTEELRAIQQGKVELTKAEAAELAAYAIENELVDRYGAHPFKSGGVRRHFVPTDQSKIRVAA